MKVKKAYFKLMDGIEYICFRLIGVMMMVMVAVVVYQVFLRYVMSRSNLWSEEVARYLCVYVTYIGAFIAIRRNSHLKVDFFVDLLNEQMRRLLMLTTSIAVSLFLVYMTYQGVVIVQGGFRNVTAGLNMPMAYAYVAIPLGGVLMVMGMLEQVLKLAFPDPKVPPEKESAASRSESEVSEG